MHELNDEELTGLVVEVTGAAHDASTVKLTVSCIKHLKDHARFDVIENASEPVGSIPEKRQPHENTTSRHIPSGLGLNLGYTINLNLPATSDPAVFDAIFKSLKQHLLTAQDG